MRAILSFLMCFGVHSLLAVDSDEQKLIEILAKDNFVAFDVGAHGGEWTDIVLKYSPNAKLVLFEPSSFLFESLHTKYNVHRNISVFHLGLSNKTGNLILYNPGSPLAGYYFRPGCHNQDLAETIPVTTMDIFCLQHNISHIDLLKIDTEGAELDILRGASNLLVSKSIDVIQFEYGGTYLDSKITLKEVFDFLMFHGYKILRIENEEIININKWNSSLENYNLANYCAYNPRKFSKSLNK
jgi:FkbM family methyltransferase